MRGDTAKTVRYTGTAEPFTKFEVSARLNGQVETVQCKKSDEVKKSQTILTLDPSECDLKVKAAAAALTRAVETLARVRKPYRDEEIREARAAVERAAAVQKDAEVDRRRIEALAKEGGASKDERDTVVVQE